MKSNIITFPRFGNYTIIFQKFFEELELKYIIPPPITKRTIEIGTEELDELMCVKGDTKITIDNFTSKGIKDIKIGDKVLTHRGRFRKATKIFSRNYNGDILKIDCGGFLKIDITPEHPLLVVKRKHITCRNAGKQTPIVCRPNNQIYYCSRRKRSCKKIKGLINFEPKFVSAKDIEKGDFIAIPSHQHTIKTPSLIWKEKYKPQTKYRTNKFVYSNELLRVLDNQFKLTKKRNNSLYVKTNKYILVKVKNIIEEKFKGKLYNLEVEEDNSYTANYLAVHNCYPSKTTLGNFTEAIEKGANTLVMFSTEGDCRFKNYYRMHELVLKKKGYKFRMCPIRFWSFFKDIKRIDKSITIFKILKACKRVWKKILEIEKEDSEKNPKNPILKIMVTGEIYCVNETKVNMDLIQKLRELNVYVDFSPKVSQFIKEFVRLDFLKRKKTKKKAKEYLPHRKWCGHGFETLCDTIDYIKKGYDGAFHVYPFPCSPNSAITKYLDMISEEYDFPIQHLQCDEFSGEAGFDTRVEAFVDGLKFKKYGMDFKKTNKKGNWLGLDIGSVSSKAVIINEKNKVIASNYFLISGNPIEGVKKCLNGLPSVKINGVGVTGSARYLANKMIGADVIVNEITAQTIGSLDYNREIKSIIEIGGLDSKVILIKKGVPIWHNMNSKCSSGTGSFLMRESERLNIPIEKFAYYSSKSKMKINIACKCSVFAGQDCVHKAQLGFKQEDIIKGLHNGLVRNFINNTARNKKLEHPIIFNGGVASNKGVVSSFNEYFKKKIIVPEEHKVIGAKGAAIQSKETDETNFKGWKIKDIKTESKNFECNSCPNHCDIVELYQKDKLIYRTSGICKKWKQIEKFK